MVLLLLLLILLVEMVMKMVMTILLVKYVRGANGRDDDVLLFFANKDNYLTIM